MGRRQGITCFIEDLTAELRTLFGRFTHPALRCPVLHLLLNAIPTIRCNDRIVLAFVNRRLVTDAACVDRVGKDVMDMAAIEQTASCGLSPRFLSQPAA